MSIYKRQKTWWIAITAPNGVRIRKSARTSDKRAAQEYHDRLKAELWRIHRLREKPRRTWQQAAVRWVKEKHMKADLRNDIAKLRWFDPFFGDLYLDEISRDLIDEVINVKRVDVAVATANRYRALIRSILRAARDDWEWIDSIPKVRLQKETARRVRWLTKEEARRLLDELPQHLSDMAAFSLLTGLRRHNVTHLEWDAIDLKRRVAWTHPDESKAGKAIAIPLSQNAIAILQKLKGNHPTRVFTYRGKPVFQTSTKAWYAALKRAGITNFRWHDLRHTWSSWHVAAGTTLQELMSIGGWASYSMVLRYAHLSSEKLVDAAQRVDGILDL